MRSVYILIFCCISIVSFGQYSDPNFSKPSSGYGTDGSHTIGVVAFANPNFPSKNIEIFYPSDIATKVPTIFYSHGYGGNSSSNVAGLLDFVAMKGYAIVFVPYQTTGVTIFERYDNLLAGFRKAARDYPAIIDTTKVGFMGQSFGGGASFANAYKCFTENNWGQDGRFIYSTAPWYSYNITQAELQSFPSDTKLLMEIFDNDDTNDHRMSIDIYNTINISTANKDFILVRSDTINSYIYAADHYLPNTSAAHNALDYYAYYRLLDALCDYTFNGSTIGQNVALGNGSVDQITMPTGLKSLTQTDSPVVVYPESDYTFPCSDVLNPRSSYCPVLLGIKDKASIENSLLVYPNPTSSKITIVIPFKVIDKELRIYNSFGLLMLSEQVSDQALLNIDLSSFTKGIYFAIIGETKTKFIIE